MSAEPEPYGWRLALFGVLFMGVFVCLIVSAAAPDGTLREVAQGETGACFLGAMLASKLNRRPKDRSV